MNGLDSGKVESEDDELILPQVSSKWIKRLLFLGTGTSGQVPALGCLLQNRSSLVDECLACSDAVRRPGSKNRRGCTSAALIGRRGKGDEESLILIDCGPSFYSSILTHIKTHKLGRIDAILLTHAHADAILGLDSLRSWTMGGIVQDSVNVYLTQECFDTVKGMFPYLVDPSRSTGGGGVGDISFYIIDANKPFTVSILHSDSIEVVPLPAHHGQIHGKPFECLGFRIDSLSYLSDCHHIPPSTAQLMAGSQVIVLDALNPYRHASHFSLSQALSFTLSMPGPAPRLALLTDLTHNLEHYRTEASIQRWRAALQRWRHREHLEGRQEEPTGEQIGTGEGGGPRWWASQWREGEAEKRGARNDLLQSLSPALLRETETCFTTMADSVDAGETRSVMTLPHIHLAWDGLALPFQEEQLSAEGKIEIEGLAGEGF